MPEVKTNYLPYIIGIIVIIVMIVVVILITQNNLSSTITFIPSTTAQIIKSKSLSTKKIQPKSQQQLEQVSQQQLEQASQQQLEQVSQQQLEQVSQQQLEQAQIKEIITPENISITTPENISMTTPQNISTITPQNISTTTPKNISTTKKIITKKPFYFATLPPLIDKPVVTDNSTDPYLCPSNPPPPCPAGTQACAAQHGYCYWHEEDQMVSTYLGSPLDRCPLDTDSNKTNISYKIAGRDVWPRQSCIDRKLCPNIVGLDSCQRKAMQQAAEKQVQQAAQIAKEAAEKAQREQQARNPFGPSLFDPWNQQSNNSNCPMQ